MGRPAAVRAGVVAGLLACQAAAAPVAGGQAGSWSLDLGGYLHALAAVHDPGYDPGPAAAERRTGLASQVLRLRSRLRMGRSLVVEVHDRLQAR
ncbi:MAG: hypothetical protein AB1505_27365, partial [Candidatus Latescibacterota bacterium]